MSQPSQPENPLAVLLTPGERLGWVFQDRSRFRRHFGDAPPDPPAPPVELVKRAQAAKRQLARRMVAAGGLGLAFVFAFGCCGVVASFFDGRTGTAFGTLTVLALAAAAGAIGLVRAHYASLKNEVKAAQAERQDWYDRAYADWSARKAAFERDEQLRVEQLPEWRAVPPGPGTRRVDIIGGSLWGWEALLTVFGASLLSTRGAMTLVDLSGEAVSRELLSLAGDNGMSVDLLLLPNDLAESDLLVGLDGRQLVDALVESMHADSDTASRADRAMDDRILTSICEALGDDLSMARLAAALRVLTDEPGDPSALTPQERRHIGEELFGDETRRQLHPRLRRIEAYIHPLVGLGTRRGARDAATLTCLAATTDGRNARSELLNDLIVQWLIRRVAAGADELRTLVIAGADEVPRRHIERLSDLCERRDVRLVLLFRHLRDASVQTVGGGAVGFMRLANHEEARQAADFIGRQHTFAVTRVTRTLGGNETHSTADAEGVSDSDGRASHGLLGLLGPRLRVWSRNESRNWSVTRNWSQTRSVAEGINWSDATSQERVYEYAVEPRALQDLPDYAMLLVQWQPTGSVVVPVECNPDLISLPRLTMEPVPATAPDPEPATVAKVSSR